MSKAKICLSLCKFLVVRPRNNYVQYFARIPQYCQNVFLTKDNFGVIWPYREYATHKLVKKIEQNDEQVELGSEDCYCNDASVCENEKDRKKAKIRLQRLFKTSASETEKMIEGHPVLLRLTKENISENINYFAQLGLDMSVVKSEPWLLALKTTAIADRLPYFRIMGINDINVIAQLLHFPLMRIKRASVAAKLDKSLVIPGGNRVNYLSKRLHNNVVDMWKTAIKLQFLLTIPFHRLSANLDLLLKYGMTPSNILNDLWVFRYSTKTIEFRLQQAKEAGVQILKPWMVRCPDTVMEITLQRTVDSRITLGSHSTALEYLSQRLECSLDDVIALSKRYPPLLSVHVLKLKEVLDYLYEEGFTSRQVCQVPRVLCHSLETLQERLNEIRDLGHNPISLIVLCKSKRQYSEFLNKLTSLKKHSFSV